MQLTRHTSYACLFAAGRAEAILITFVALAYIVARWATAPAHRGNGEITR